MKHTLANKHEDGGAYLLYTKQR